jgi:hypothetical protein
MHNPTEFTEKPSTNIMIGLGNPSKVSSFFGNLVMNSIELKNTAKLEKFFGNSIPLMKGTGNASKIQKLLGTELIINQIV